MTINVDAIVILLSIAPAYQIVSVSANQKAALATQQRIHNIARNRMRQHRKVPLLKHGAASVIF